MATALQHQSQSDSHRCLSSDRTLQQLILGDPLAWHRLDSRARPILMTFLLKRGLQHAIAEEVAQIAISSLAQTLKNDRFQSGPGSVAAYLFTVARREIAKAIAEKQLERPSYSRGLGGEFWNSDLAFCDDRVLWENTWIQGTYRYCLERVRAGSPPGEFEAFELRIRRQMPVSCIADCLEIDVLEVSRAIHRTKRRLLEIVAELRHDEQWLYDGRLPSACRP
ncbi:MAG: sigma-70 family RNA polymerase sigma factor [Phycisphaera sp.]|nr:MAG: sigma-70 family RNA polymerase sigma factor [Phycisphaera sp.]